MAPTPLPTDAELQVLAVLWAAGEATVREVHEQLAHETGYTTTLKVLQVMAQKGLVERDESSRSHVYRARVREEPTRRKLVREFADRAFAGSAAQLALAALSARRASAEERAEVRELLARLEEGEER